jgi:hypothetical protein
VPAITIFDSQEEIPENVRDKATEVEGKFHVPADALLANYNQLTAEKKQRDADIKRLKADVEKFKDLDPEKARKALKDLEDAEAEKLRTQGDWDARETAINQGWQTKETAWNTEKSSYDKALDKFVIRNELARVSALPDIKGDFELLADNATVMSSIRRKGEDYEILEVDKEGKTVVRYGTDGQPLRMEAYLKELREHPKLSRLFDATGASGSGAAADLARGGGKAIDKTLKRSKMSDKEQQDFVRAHGYAKFKELPE